MSRDGDDQVYEDQNGPGTNPRPEGEEKHEYMVCAVFGPEERLSKLQAGYKCKRETPKARLVGITKGCTLEICLPLNNINFPELL